MRVLKYNEAKLKIMQMIGEAGLKIGDRLPTERELVARLGVSIISVHRALKDLQEAGMIRKSQGVGSFLLRDIAEARHDSLLGVVNIGDHLFPDGRRMYELTEAVKRYQAAHRIFTVAHEVEPRLLDELSQCDRFIVTGFVNRQWVEFLSGLNRPMVQLGISGFEGEICRVEHDYSTIFRRLVADFSRQGRRNLAFLVPDPEHNSNALPLRRLFRRALEEASIPWREELAPIISIASGIGDVVRGLTPLQTDLEAVITCEPSTLFPFQFAQRHLHLPADILIGVLEECNFLPRDVGRWWPNLYNVYFEDSIMAKAVEVLYEYPYSFLENHDVVRIAPVIVHGAGEESGNRRI